jgi:hypothetical protein
MLWVSSPSGDAPVVMVAPSSSPVASSADTETVVPVEATPSATTTAATVVFEIKTPTELKAYTAPLPRQQATVAEILQSMQATGAIYLKTKDYGGTLGLFVEEINGVRNAPESQFYWHLYLNGKRSPLGASSATVQAGDSIQWSYEKEQAQ